MFSKIARKLLRRNVKDMKGRVGRKVKQHIRYLVKEIFCSHIIPCN